MAPGVDSPVARAAAATQPAASPCGPRPATGSPVAVEPRRGAEVESAEEADDPSRLGPVARRGQGYRHHACVARPDVGPAVAGAGADGARAADRSAPATPAASAGTSRPRPARRRGTQGPRPRRASADRSARGPVPVPPQPIAATTYRPRRAEARHGPQHVGPRQIALGDRVRAPERNRPTPDPHPGDDPGIRRHAAGQPAERVGCRSATGPPAPAPQVDHVPVGVDRRDPTAVADHRGGEERRRQPRQRRRRPRIGAESRRRPGPARPSRPRQRRCAARVHATRQCNQPPGVAVASLPACAATRAPPRRGSSVGRAHD